MSPPVVLCLSTGAVGGLLTVVSEVVGLPVCAAFIGWICYLLSSQDMRWALSLKPQPLSSKLTTDSC